MRALVILNENDTDAGLIAERAGQRGFVLDHVIRERPDELPDPTAYDLVISLGSVWSVYWDEVRPYVSAEHALLRAAVEADVPVLGICFGAQMLASALGGAVEKLPEPEIGWHAVRAHDPDLVPDGPWFQWHYDGFSVPPGAVELARNDVSSQAFRIGRSLAVQFHPEVDERIVAIWAESAGTELERSGIDPDAVLAATRAMSDRARADAHTLFDTFWDRIAGAREVVS